MSPQPFDEMRNDDGSVRAHYRAFADWLDQTISRVVDNDSLLSRMLAEAVRCISAALL